MSAFVPERLVPLLGRDAWRIDAQGLDRLLDMPESEELDFKREPCGASDGDKRDFALDVAAFANRRGGLIVIGVDESPADGRHQIVPLSGEQLDVQELRFRKIMAAQCAPAVEMDVIPVRVDGGGVLIVSVAPSPRRPHAVAVNDSLRYPVRDGSSKRCLTESEVAAAYRDRFAEAAAQVSTLQDRHKLLFAQLRRPERVWLTVALQPDRAGRVEYSRSMVDETRNFVNDRLCRFPSWHGNAAFYVKAGFRSYRFRDAAEEVHARTGSLYLDGGGAVAHGWDYRGELPDESSAVRLSDEDLVAALINSLGLLVGWAVDRAGSDGDAAVVAQVHPPARGAVLWEYRSSFPDALHGTSVLEGVTPLVDLTLNLRSAASDGVDLLLTARSLAEDLMSGFEFIEPYQIDRSGRLRTRYFYNGRVADIERWAEAHGVETTTET
jgi:hypothetical protein